MIRRSLAPAALLVVALLLAVSPSARAGGMNLSWDDCGAFGNVERDFACDTNSGFNILDVSAIAPTPLPQLNGMSCSIDLLSQQATISPWWSFDAVGCRGVTPSALHGSADFTGGPFNCVDPWSGQASGGASYQTGFNGPNRARMKGVCAVAVSVPMDASSEYYLFSFIITNAMTVGAGSCAGCTDGVCLVLQSVLLTQPVGPGLFDYTITNPLLRQHVTWQPGGTQVTGGCPGGTPVRTRTWGGVKALYR